MFLILMQWNFVIYPEIILFYNNNNNNNNNNGANKPDVIVHDKETNIWTLFEGTVCHVGKIVE